MEHKTINLGFSVMESSNPVRERAKSKLTKAIVLNDDKVKDIKDNTYPISNESITIKGLKIYYRKDGTVIIQTMPYRGCNHDCRPYFVGMQVNGYINKDKHFVITKYEHKF